MGFGEASDVSACYYAGANDKYTGMKQNSMAYFHYGDVKSIMLTTELLKNTGNHNLLFGLNQWYYDIVYWSNTIRFDQQVTEYPRLLGHTLNASSDSQITNYAYNYGGSEYYDGYENSLALYMTYNWDVTNELNIYFEGRAEYYRLKGKNLSYARIGNCCLYFIDY